MKYKQLYQGDIGLLGRVKLPKDAKPIKPRPLAIGEQTGHNHEILGPHTMYEVADGTVWVVAEPGAQLAHPDHGVVTETGIAPVEIEGVYEVRRQTETDPFTGIRRQVSD